MATTLVDKDLVQVKETTVKENVDELCRLRDHYQKDLDYFTDKLKEVKDKIQIAKDLGYKEA